VPISLFHNEGTDQDPIPGTLLRQTTSGVNGHFEIFAIQPGRYVLTISQLPELHPTTPPQAAITLFADAPLQQISFGVLWYRAKLYLPWIAAHR